MSDYFDRLEAELRTAVPRVATERSGATGSATEGSATEGSATEGSATARPARGRRRAWLPGAYGIALAVAVCVAVVVGAVALLGHRHAAPSPRHGAVPPPARVAAPPTLAQLKANFAVLRRPQTAADRAWGPGHASQLIAGLTRLARQLPGGQRVFLTVDRDSAHALWLWIVGPGADRVGTPFTAANGYAVLPVGTPAPGRRTTRWTSLVPDGVDRVRWTFGCRARCAPIRHFVPVLGNVATAPVAGTEPCTDPECRTAIRTDWFVGDELSMTFNGRIASRMVAPPFVERFLRASRPVVVALRADGLAPVPFGAAPAALEPLLESLLGPPTPRGLGAGPGCGVDQTLTWPVVLDPNSGRIERAIDLVVFFARGRFVGYSYGGAVATRTAGGRARLVGSTDRGLRLGDTMARGERLYGRSFHLSYAQGGSWWIGNPSRGLRGYAGGKPPPRTDIGPHSTVTSIDAGNVGCPALSP